MKSAVDHIIFIVKDLKPSIECYKILLGRNPSWKGSHPAFKTKNALFRLNNTYIELLADASEDNDSATESTFVKDFLAQNKPGLAGLCFGTPNASEMVTHMQRQGIEALGPMPGEGKDELSGAVRHWLNVFWPNSASRGLWTFGIQHLDSLDTLPMSSVTSSPLGNKNENMVVDAVDHVVIQTGSLEAAKKFYGEALGIRLALELPNHPLGNLLFFKTTTENKLVLEVIQSKDNKEEVKDEDKFWGIAYKTPNIDATQERLVTSGVKVSEVRRGMKPGTRVCTVKSHNLGVPTLLIGPDSPEM